MRLSDLKLNPLVEAARFGNQQLSYIKSRSDEFKIGIEYEFELDDDYIEMSYDSSEFQAAAKKEIETDLIDNGVVSEFADIDDNMKTSFVFMDSLNDFVEVMNTTFSLDDGDPFIGDKIISRIVASSGRQLEFDFGADDLTTKDIELIDDASVELASFSRTVNTLIDITNQISPTIIDMLLENLQQSYAYYHAPVDKHSEFISKLENFKDIAANISEVAIPLREPDHDNISPEWVRNARTLASLLGKLKPLIEDWNAEGHKVGGVRHLMAQGRPIVVELFDDEIDSAIPELKDSGRFDDLVSDSEFESESDAVSTAKNLLQQSVDHSMIEAIHSEHMHNGVEAKTIPLSLNDTLDFMESMFNFIDEYASTTNDTGMHVNISHKSFENKTPDKVSLLKLMLLMDTDFMQSVGGKVGARGKKWVERGQYALSLERKLEQREITPVATLYNKQGIQGVIDYMAHSLVETDKYSTINYTAMLTGSSSARRLEYRFFGGADYHKKFQEIEHDIYFACYTILAAVEPKFLQKEFYQAVIRMLDKWSKKSEGMPFLSLASKIKKEGASEPLERHEQLATIAKMTSTKFDTVEELKSSDLFKKFIKIKHKSKPMIYRYEDGKVGIKFPLV